MEGVEPTCLAALDPKSSASANFATSANKGCKSRGFSAIGKELILGDRNWYFKPTLLKSLQV